MIQTSSLFLQSYVWFSDLLITKRKTRLCVSVSPLYFWSLDMCLASNSTCFWYQHLLKMDFFANLLTFVQMDFATEKSCAAEGVIWSEQKSCSSKVLNSGQVDNLLKSTLCIIFVSVEDPDSCAHDSWGKTPRRLPKTFSSSLWKASVSNQFILTSCFCARSADVLFNTGCALLFFLLVSILSGCCWP